MADLSAFLRWLAIGVVGYLAVRFAIGFVGRLIWHLRRPSASYVFSIGRWPRRCRCCGERMLNPQRWAHRRCALTLMRLPQLVPAGQDHCPGCGDTNYDMSTRICLTCMFPNHPCSGV